MTTPKTVGYVSYGPAGTEVHSHSIPIWVATNDAAMMRPEWEWKEVVLRDDVQGITESAFLVELAQDSPASPMHLKRWVNIVDLPAGTYELYLKPPAPTLAIPDGFQLVPVEPDQWMRTQGNEGFESKSITEIWRRMLAAAPKAPEVAVEPKRNPKPVYWGEIQSDTLERLLVGTATEGDQMLAHNLIDEVSVYYDIYNDFVDLIDPFVAAGQLPASVHDSMRILLEHWGKTAVEPPAVPVRSAEDAAKFIEKKVDDYAHEYGQMEQDTGAMNFSRAGRDYVDCLSELAEEIRGWAKLPPAVPVDQVEYSKLVELLRSARHIADRKGENTAWERFANSIADLGISGITARTYRMLPSDPVPVSAKNLQLQLHWKCGIDQGPVAILYTDIINDEPACRDDLWLCTTDQLRVNPFEPVVAAEPVADFDLINAMCMTWRHDFGLDDNPKHLALFSGMTDIARQGLRDQMCQLLSHHGAAIATLYASPAKLEDKDAERYRWLRDNYEVLAWRIDRSTRLPGKVDFPVCQGMELNENIDAAIEVQKVTK